MNDNYSAASGQGIYAGRFNLPAWRQNLAVNEWTAIPQAYTLDSIQPMLNPAINPVYPSKPEFYLGNFGGLISAWNGACYDDSTGDFLLPLQGGHLDYGGNEPYKLNVFADSVAWQMIRYPTGAVGNTVSIQDGQESTGLYADGRLRSVHSYNYPVAGNGRMFMGGLSAMAASGQGAKRWCVEINKSTGEYTLVTDYSARGMGEVYGGACFDTTRNRVFVAGSSQSRFIAVDVDTNAVTNLSTVTERFVGYPRPLYAQQIDKVVIISPPTTSNLFAAQSGITVVDQDTGQTTYPAVIGAAPAWFTWNGAGSAWGGDCVYLWNNSSSTQNILKLTPAGNPATDPWQLSEIAGTGVTPTTRTSNGTFGRLQYSARLGGLILFNGTTQPLYFMRTN